MRRSNYYSRPGPYNRNDRGSGNRRNGDNIKGDFILIFTFNYLIIFNFENF